MQHLYNQIENFTNNDVYISDNSFKQNYYIKRDLRFYVNNIITNDVGGQVNDYKDVVCIGGESYLFGLTSPYIKYITNYTNSKYIYNDVHINNKLYQKNLKNYIIDYNKFSNIISGSILIINLAKLNINLLNIINKRFYKVIVIINCHHDEFWRRIKLLTNYKLTNRKQFINDKKYNFITVNTLIYKYEMPEFISLGTTCAIAYQLKNLGLKYNKYPFDWSKTNINKINNVLKNDFDKYNIVKVNKLSANHNYKFQENTSSYILSNSYNITFAHELLNAYTADIDLFQNEILNRINTFKYKKNNYIIFILLDLNNTQKTIYNQLEQLIINLKIYFTNFKLLYITSINIDINLSNLNNVKIIKIKNLEFIDWMYSNHNWFDIIYNNL
jgi:hypothetical protein